MKDNLHTLIFAVVLALVCSLLLATTSRLTTPYREANEKAEEVRNFLSALEVPFDPAAGPKSLVELFERSVRVTPLDDMTLYEYREDTDTGPRVAAIAVPFSGPGLWGPIKGVMALEPDWLTIRAVRFYKQEETPGLGGEIGAAWFLDQFRGKQIVSEAGEPGFTIAPGAAATRANGVDDVTGATMTSDRVADMLNALAVRICAEREEQ